MMFHETPDLTMVKFKTSITTIALVQAKTGCAGNTGNKLKWVVLEALFPLFPALDFNFRIFGFFLEGQLLLIVDKLFNNSNCLHCIIPSSDKFVDDLLYSSASQLRIEKSDSTVAVLRNTEAILPQKSRRIVNSDECDSSRIAQPD